MMIDTVKLRSPYLCEEEANIIEQGLKRRSAVEIATGDVLYEITSNDLAGSFDNRIMVRLLRDEITSVAGVRGSASEYEQTEIDLSDVNCDAFVVSQLTGSLQVQKARELVARQKADARRKDKSSVHRKITVLRPCPPYLIVECSVHKAMIGHNISGGPSSFQPAIAWLIAHLEDLLWVKLPHYLEWNLEKVDVTECYNLPFLAIEEWIGTMALAKYPRRKIHAYGSEAVMFPGTTSAVKFYHKGPEFAKHDAKKLRDQLTESDLFELQTLANGIMRVEVSIKSKKLQIDFAKRPSVADVTDEYLIVQHDREVQRILREGRSDMKTVRTSKEVSERLSDCYASELSQVLYGVWARLCTQGEKEVKQSLKKPTWYRYRKQLETVGVSWTGADIVITKSNIPADFALVRSDRRRDSLEDFRVTTMLEKYREAI